MSSMKLLAGAVITSVALSGCAVTNPELQAQAEGPELVSGVERDIFALLSEGTDGYTFTHFATAPVPNHLPWVRLSDLEPAWAIPSSISCYDFLWGMGESCATIPEDRSAFMKRGLSGDEVPGWIGVSALTLGVGALWKPTELRFDRVSYDAAVSEAASSLGAREKFVREYDRALGDFHSKLDSIEKEYETAAAPTISAQVIDRSGVYNPELHYDYLPDFITRHRPLNEARYLEPKDYSSLDRLLQDTRSRINEGLKEAESIAEALTVGCISQLEAPMAMTFECPPEVSVGVDELKVPITINYVDFVDFLPNRLLATSEHLYVYYLDDQVHLVNRSDQYVTLKAVTLQNEDEFLTFTPDMFVQGVVPPSASQLIIEDVPDAIRRHVFNVTGEDATEHDYVAGIMAQYEVGTDSYTIRNIESKPLADWVNPKPRANKSEE